MGINSNIEWTGQTWNPWHGCKKVSPGCKFCYMYRDKDRYNQDPTVVIRSKDGTFNAPLFWGNLNIPLVFTCSWSDFFIEEADEWRPEAWDVIRKTPHLTYQILTKRPERILEHLPEDWGSGWDNVWLGISAENQEMYDRRVPVLLEVPARVRWISAEPLIGPIYAGAIQELDWVVIGGESGNEEGPWGYRPSQLDWFQNLISDCYHNDVPVFMKQTGTFLSNMHGLSRHGKVFEEWPASWLIGFRQFPKCYVGQTK